MSPTRILVYPVHDPRGVIIPILLAHQPPLESYFSHTVASITPPTLESQPELVRRLQTNGFYTVVTNSPGTGSGDHHFAGFQKALEISSPDTVLHLTDVDRFAQVLTFHQDQYFADLARIRHLPLQFLRSPAAWSTHPSHYCQIEGLATRLGQVLFHKNIDFCWCYLALSSADLQSSLPSAPGPAQNIYAQIVLRLLPRLCAKHVDWLTWEDPLVLGRDPISYPRERSFHPEDVKKRLSYVLPMLDLISQSATSLPSSAHSH